MGKGFYSFIDLRNEMSLLAKASIIIPVFNKMDFTKNCVAKIFKTSLNQDYEIIIIDNGSTDGTKAFLQTLGDRINVIYNFENNGFVGACNQGAAISRRRTLFHFSVNFTRFISRNFLGPDRFCPEVPPSKCITLHAG